LVKSHLASADLIGKSLAKVCGFQMGRPGLGG
jgi:hypothetical protein